MVLQKAETTLENGAKINSAAVSRILREAFCPIPDVTVYHQTGEQCFLHKSV